LPVFDLFGPASSAGADYAAAVFPWPGSLGGAAAVRGRLAKAKSRQSRDEDWWSR